MSDGHCGVPPYQSGQPIEALMVHDFIERKNIAKFTTLLLQETDPAKRGLLQNLLTNEMVKQASLNKLKHTE